MNVAIALGIVASLYAYVAVGRAYFARVNAADAVVHPELAESCEFRAGLHAGYPGALFTRYVFLAFWPVWMLVGLLLARLAKNG